MILSAFQLPVLLIVCVLFSAPVFAQPVEAEPCWAPLTNLKQAICDKLGELSSGSSKTYLLATPIVPPYTSGLTQLRNGAIEEENISGGGAGGGFIGGEFYVPPVILLDPIDYLRQP